jgi:aspartate kinase
MARLVMKFGGTSVATLERIQHAVAHVKREIDAGHEVAVVVSAMAGKTDELVAFCKQASSRYDHAEYDCIVASGEQVSAGLFAIALQAQGIPARSWQGWQLPIKTDHIHGAARILHIDCSAILTNFIEKKVAVITGFQGLSTQERRITTLGRGGSDTSAVALAAALKADRCDIYTDVKGIYTTDPRIVPRACLLRRVSFEETLEMASLGARVLQVRSVELAMIHNVKLRVRSTFEDPKTADMGTLICAEEDVMKDQEPETLERSVVTGVTYSRDEAQITLRRVFDTPGVAAAIFNPLADANINVDMIVQVGSDGTPTSDMTFTVPISSYDQAKTIIESNKEKIGFDTLHGTADVVKISVIGVGMKSHAGVAAKAFTALAEKGINIRAITTSEIKFSLLIDAAYTELAVRILHALYGLDDAGETKS